MERNDNILPRWCWSTALECVVEVLRRGHFPNTVIVKIPDGRQTEVEEQELRTYEQLAQPE